MAAVDNGDNPHCRTPVGFIEEINFDELELKEPVGKGSFGVVYEAVYRKMPVAVKMIESESERIAFITELRQLSRVSHKNIIQLYGACSSPVSLVMELAECGSLYNLLHGLGPLPHYTGGHGISWCLQCAKGVAYLHGMKPKALVHRDLKPPNLLLTNFGTTLKICDFGTACDIHTHMTNNKGSAAWMAPEVFEGCQYSERCDVFSWGIIFWEVLTRRKPFDELGGPAFRIMWAVHMGARPPLIQGCPKPIEDLMTSCWSKTPNDRPSMNQVVEAMEILLPFFSGANEPLRFPCEDEDSDEMYFSSETTDGSFTGTQTSTFSDTVLPSNPPPRIPPNLMQSIRTKNASPVFKAQEVDGSRQRSGSQSPVLGSLADYNKTSPKRRSSSELIAEIEKTPIDRKSPVHSRSGSPSRVMIRTSSGTSSPLVLSHPKPPAPANIPPVIPPVPIKRHVSDEDDYAYANDDTPSPTANSAAVSMAYLTLELHLQPLPPSGNSKESMQIYEDHCKLAQEYLRVQTEIAMLRSTELERKKELEQVEKDKEVNKLQMEYQQLMAENKHLGELSQKMKSELDVSRGKQQQRMM